MKAKIWLLAMWALWGCQPIGEEPEEPPVPVRSLAEGEPCKADSECKSNACWRGACYGADCKADPTVCREGYGCRQKAGSCNFLGCSSATASCLKKCTSTPEGQCGFGYDCQGEFCIASAKPWLTVPKNLESAHGVPIKMRVTAEAPTQLLQVTWEFEVVDQYGREELTFMTHKPEDMTMEPSGPNGVPVYVSELTHAFNGRSNYPFVRIRAWGDHEGPVSGTVETVETFYVDMCYPAGGSCSPTGNQRCCAGLACVTSAPNGSARCQ